MEHVSPPLPLSKKNTRLAAMLTARALEQCRIKRLFSVAARWSIWCASLWKLGVFQAEKSLMRVSTCDASGVLHNSGYVYSSSKYDEALPDLSPPRMSVSVKTSKLRQRGIFTQCCVYSTSFILGIIIFVKKLSSYLNSCMFCAS